MYFSFHGIVGVEVEDCYPWFDTLFINPMLAMQNEEEFAGCRKFIKVRYLHKLKPHMGRSIGKGILLTDSAFIDSQYGACMSWENASTIVIQTAQECNEWLLICLQIMLLSEDYCMIHGSAFTKDGRGLLVPSWSGTGKTAIVASLVREEGWQLLGDDIVIINEQGDILSFFEDLVIYAHHKDVFPELFAQGHGPVAPLALNRLLTNMVSVVKPLLRTVPALLAFARKHNPQSKRISPYKVFAAHSLAERAVITQVIWLERSLADQEAYKEVAPRQIAAKAAAVSLMEILTDRSWAVLALCGSEFIDYESIFVKIYNIYCAAFSRARVYELNVPVSVEIGQVANVFIDNLNKTSADV